MSIVWRLAQPKYARLLDGEGNRKQGARWNPAGRGVVYTSDNLSLCVLEALVNFPLALRRRLPPMDAVRIDIPDDCGVSRVERADMPWDLHPDRLLAWCRAAGDAWLQPAENLLLSAPSVVVPQERNVMLNPAHPEMGRVRIISIEAFTLDPRLHSSRAH